MGKLNRQSGTAWRATFVLLALLFGALTPAVKLVLPEPITCGMACCLESGECCCLTQFDGEHRDGHEAVGHAEEAVLKQAALTSGCLPNCATAPAASPTFLLKAERASAFNFTRTLSSQRPHEQQCPTLAHFPFNPASPRAPPPLFISHSL
jgi:hypothetical protein